MILSVIIISHNQKDQFRRCIDSILAQELPFEHEIIVSDDKSTDGTWELAKQYETRFAGLVKAFQCDSNDCNPANTSHRSGWNRCNAYPHVTGKYIAHVDADDYFRPGADVYRRQVEALEMHPECYLAMSDCLVHNDGECLSEAHRWHSDIPFRDADVISGADFIKSGFFVINQSFIQRRNPDVDPAAIYGKRYVDAIITYHHLQFGPIVYVDACDYVYVQYGSSVTGVMAQTDDHMVIWCNGIYIPALIPMWRHDFYLSDNRGIRDVVSLARRGYTLQEKNKRSIEDLGLYIYDAFNRPLTFFDKCRLFLTSTFLRAMDKYGWNKKADTDILHFLLCK